MKSGIYAITNVVTTKMYIGKSKSIRRRWSDHRYKLRKGAHENKYLQRAWDKYGESVFSFVILEEADIDLESVELKYIEQFKGRLYNVCLESTVGMTGRTHSNEAKEKMKLAKIGKKKPPLSDKHKLKIRTALLGKKFTKEHRDNLSRANKGKSHKKKD